MNDIVVGFLVLAVVYLSWIVVGYKLVEKEQKLH
jgi:ammonia channel protein AmtB